MPGMNEQPHCMRRWLTAACFAAALGAMLAAPSIVQAQVVVVANGSPITELDIQQRTKLMASSNNKTPPRQEVIIELIDDRLKIAKAKTYGMEISDSEVEGAFEKLAQRQRVSVAQFIQLLERGGISPNALKARMRAELTWNQLVRGKYGSTLQVGESDIANAMRSRNEADNAKAGYIYTLYPVTVVVARGASEAVKDSKRREAENLRERFVACNEGLTLARALRDVAVRDPVHRSSADLAPQLRELLDNMPIGRLTTPEVTAQGLQMYALCSKKESSAESSVKREMREQIYTKRFETESKKFLDEIRKQAMIEYK